MRRAPGAPAVRLRRAAGVVFALVTSGLLIAAGLILASEDRGGPRTATFPDGRGGPAVVSPLGSLRLDPGSNGTAFVNDNLWTSGDEQLAVWAAPDGSPLVGRRRLPDGPWATADLGEIPGNPLAAPTEADPHNVYAIAADSQGYVHVAGNMHADPLRYVRSVWPGSIDDWTAANMVGTGEASVTYPAFVPAPDGALLFFYRDGGAGGGDTILNRRAPGSDAWERVATLVDGRSGGQSAYLQHVAVDPRRGEIHVMFLWRGDRDPASNGDVAYSRSPDGGRTWVGTDGSRLQLPLTSGTAQVALAREAHQLEILNQGGLAVDGEGRPHGVFRARSPAQGEGVLHVWRDDAGWRQELLLTDRAVGGRPAVVAGGGGVYLLWTERDGARRSILWLTELGSGTAQHELELARLPVADWEPTFDSVALAERGELHVLLPVAAGGDGGGRGAVASWDLASLAAGLGALTRPHPAPRCPPGECPPPRRAARRDRRNRRRPECRRPPRRRWSCGPRPSGGGGGDPTTTGERRRRSWS